MPAFSANERKGIDGAAASEGRAVYRMGCAHQRGPGGDGMGGKAKILTLTSLIPTCPETPAQKSIPRSGTTASGDVLFLCDYLRIFLFRKNSYQPCHNKQYAGNDVEQRDANESGDSGD